MLTIVAELIHPIDNVHGSIDDRLVASSFPFLDAEPH